MSFAAIVARAFDQYDITAWPEQAESITQRGTYTLVADEPSFLFDGELYEELEDVSGLPWMSDYHDEGESITKEAFLKWQAANVPEGVSFATFFARADEDAVGKIAELNKQVGVLVEQIKELSESIGLDVEINLGSYGSLDPNGPWDSSSAYC